MSRINIRPTLDRKELGKHIRNVSFKTTCIELQLSWSLIFGAFETVKLNGKGLQSKLQWLYSVRQ